MMHVNMDLAVLQQIATEFASGLSPKFYRLRSGLLGVVLFESTGEEWSKFLGAYYNAVELGKGEWIPCKWGPNGVFGSINENLSSTPLDLIMPSESEKESA